MRPIVKISSVVLMVMIGIIGLAVAQGAPQPPPGGFGGGMPGNAGSGRLGGGGLRGEQLLLVLQDQLKLKAKQVEQIRAALEEQTAKQQELFQKYQGQQGQQAVEAWQAEVQTIQAAFDQALAKILNKTQLQDYTALQEQLRDPIEQTMALWKVQLKLKDKQVEQLRAVLQTQIQKQQALFQQYQEQQAQLQADTQSQIGAVLTAEQLQIYQQLSQQRPRQQ